jgi:hypothetical protein
MAQQLTDVIAERMLVARKPGSDAVAEIWVRVGRPYPDTDPDGDWICPIQILGLGAEEVANVYGIDAVQALTLALQKAGIDLAAGVRSGLDLRWLDGSDLGFPLPLELPPE